LAENFCLLEKLKALENQYYDIPEGDRDCLIATSFESNGEFDVTALDVVFEVGLLKYFDTFPGFVSVLGDATFESPVEGLKKDNKLGCFDI
jgi:hypothetical protein